MNKAKDEYEEPTIIMNTLTSHTLFLSAASNLSGLLISPFLFPYLPHVEKL